MNNTKFCPRCTEYLPVEDFHRNKARSDGRTSYCKSCMADYRKPQQYSHAADRKYRLKKFGLTEQQYKEMLEAQGGVCAICGQAEQIVIGRGGRKKVRNLSVDHDHDTGAVRGLLCMHCNTGLGKLGDSVEGLERALEYLRKFETGDLDASR